MIPLYHDLHDERVAVFGGGSVAARKASVFEREANVVVVSESFHDRFEDLACDTIRATIDAELVELLVDDAFLAIPATDDEALNQEIEEIAREGGCLVNRVDRAGDTITPSAITESNVSIAISTGGKSPATSKYLRQRLESEIERADSMIEIQSKLRTELAARDSSVRREKLWAVLEDERVWEAIEAGNDERAETLAREHL